MKTIILAIILVMVSTFAQAANRSVTVEWGYDSTATDLAGFVLYRDGVKLTTFNDPVARKYSGDIDISDADACYTLTAIDLGGNETPHSACYHYDPAPDGTPGNLRVTVVVEVQVQTPEAK